MLSMSSSQTYCRLDCSKCGNVVRGWFKISHKSDGGKDLESIYKQFDSLPIAILCADCVDEITGTDTIEDSLMSQQRQQQQQQQQQQQKK